MNGIDVSNNNASVDWSGVEFCFRKATEGVGFSDSTQLRYATAAKAAGIPDGPYHFAHPDQNSADAEAQFFLSHAIPGQFWALDCETRGNTNPLAIMGADRLAAWCDRFYDVVAPMLGPSAYHYTFRSYADQVWPRLARPWRWWLASATGYPAYTSYAGRTVDIEQWGITGGLDRNIAYTAISGGAADDMTPDEHAQLANINNWIGNITPVIQSQIANAINDPNAGVMVRLAHIEAVLASLSGQQGQPIDTNAVATALVKAGVGQAVVDALKSQLAK